MTHPDVQPRSETDGNMIIDWDVPITMNDGTVLRADVFRPDGGSAYPALITHGPYGKGITWTEGVYETQWKALVEEHPDVLDGSSGRYQSWETPDPEKWVPWGYAIVRIDSRGAGRSPGHLDPFSPREIEDFHHCIEWTAEQPWCTGKVGLAGISYYAISQYLVAGTQPPHLAAICPWEGAADLYRDGVAHGGIPSSFWGNWIEKQIAYIQHGVGERGLHNPNNGELASGPPTLSDDELTANRADMKKILRENPLATAEYYRQRSVVWPEVDVPLLAAANWGGQGLHPRGSYSAFRYASSAKKWLEVHGLEHWTHFYTAYGLDLQRRFFDHFLQDDDNGWDRQPPVLLQIRHVDGFVERPENEWPLARTQWTKLYVDLDQNQLTWTPPARSGQRSFSATDEKITVYTAPFAADTEITGPVSAKLSVSSSTTDADIFVVVHLVDPAGAEVTFAGTTDPHTPIGQGWLRASHRKLDTSLSTPEQPVHPHDEIQPVTPDEIVELDVEIIPTCIVIPKGHRLAVSVRGSDYEYEGDLGDRADMATFANVMKGCGPFLHNDPVVRPADIFGGTTTVHTGSETPSYLLLPIIPASDSDATPSVS